MSLQNMSQYAYENMMRQQQYEIDRARMQQQANQNVFGGLQALQAAAPSPRQSVEYQPNLLLLIED